MIRAGAIDIGTNTTLALLAESDGDTLHTIKDSLTPNHLGEALSEDGTLPTDAIAVNVDLLHELVREFRSKGAADIVICSTAVLRTAKNREEFQHAVRDILGLELKILSGTQEAALTYAGAVSTMELLPHERVNVIDLGGGSTEVISGQGNTPGQSVSLEVGAVMLTKRYFTQGAVPSIEEIQHLRSEVRKIQGDLFSPGVHDGVPWVLVGGTPVTLAMLKHGMTRYLPEKISGTTLTPHDIDGMIDRFSGKHPEELQALPAMPPGRGKYILAGTLLLRELFDVLQIGSGTVTERGLRHGIWLAHFGRQEV
jgi:exopolyphosphatase/guanosine-5'-triphosphate,3'-diphosphate pyrophosphatase